MQNNTRLIWHYNAIVGSKTSKTEQKWQQRWGITISAMALRRQYQLTAVWPSWGQVKTQFGAPVEDIVVDSVLGRSFPGSHAETVSAPKIYFFKKKSGSTKDWIQGIFMQQPQKKQMLYHFSPPPPRIPLQTGILVFVFKKGSMFNFSEIDLHIIYKRKKGRIHRNNVCSNTNKYCSTSTVKGQQAPSSTIQNHGRLLKLYARTLFLQLPPSRWQFLQIIHSRSREVDEHWKLSL